MGTKKASFVTKDTCFAMGDPINAVRAFSRAGLSAGMRQSGMAPSKHVMTPCISKPLSDSCTALHQSLCIQHICGLANAFCAASDLQHNLCVTGRGQYWLVGTWLHTALQTSTARELWSQLEQGMGKGTVYALRRCAGGYHEILQHTLGPQVGCRCMLWPGLTACSLRSRLIEVRWLQQIGGIDEGYEDGLLKVAEGDRLCIGLQCKHNADIFRADLQPSTGPTASTPISKQIPL